jgi:hypothetical protein
MIANYQYYGPLSSSSQVVVSPYPITVVNNEIVGVNMQSYGATCFRMDDIADEERYQCWADLVHLQPSSTYYYMPVISYDDRNMTTNSLKFRTGPSNGDFTFISGGNLQWTDDAYALAKFAASQEPLFAFVGGDMSLDNGNANCYRDWDRWFTEWKRNMVTPSGYAIPLLTCIGDNEASDFMTPRAWNAFYLRYFPHQLDLASTIPQDRLLYHTHVFSNHSMFVVLDSGIHTTPEYQSVYLEFILNKYNVLNKFLGYHLGMYPSRPPNHMEKELVHEMRDAWGPVIDHYNVTFAFENHFERFKMTKKIRNGQVTDGVGTIYLGDGAWGLAFESDTPDWDLFEDLSATPSLFVVSASKTGACVQPYGRKDGEIEELYDQPICMS